MNPLTIVTGVTTLIVSTGAGAIAGNAVKLTVPATANLAMRLCMTVGGFALGGVVGDLASQRTNEAIVNTTEQVQELKKFFAKKTETTD